MLYDQWNDDRKSKMTTRDNCDRMVVEFTITSAIKVVSSSPVHSEVYLIQHYVIKFVTDLRQVSGFLWVLRFPPPIKLAVTI